MPKIAHLVINPTAGGYSPTRCAAITAALEGCGFTPEVLSTEGPDDAGGFARRICAGEAEPFIIAGGGDGTVNGVVNGLAPGRATLAVIPMGTSNVLAREIGIVSIDDALRRIARGRARSMSVGLLEKGEVSRHFLLMAGIGFDGAVVEQVRPGEKRALKQGAYILSALRCLCSWEEELFEVTADGKRIACHSVVVCNGARYGGKFLMAPGADIFTPRFDLVCITGNRRGTYVRAATRLLSGRGLAGKDVALLKGSDVTIGGARPVQLDGDYVCHAPVRLRAVRDFVRLIV